MQNWEINYIKVTADDSITREEAEQYVSDEQTRFSQQDKVLGRVELRVCDNGEVEIKSTPQSPISRVRRITGYLSTIERFNDSKQAELHDRVSHI